MEPYQVSRFVYLFFADRVSFIADWKIYAPSTVLLAYDLFLVALMRGSPIADEDAAIPLNLPKPVFRPAPESANKGVTGGNSPKEVHSSKASALAIAEMVWTDQCLSLSGIAGPEELREYGSYRKVWTRECGRPSR